MIQACDPSIKVKDTMDSVHDVVSYFSAGKDADLVLMDIQLSDGKSFEIFDKVRIEAPIIFTTAFDQYALRAFKLHSIDYLLKPIQAKDLSLAIEKLKKVYRRAYLTDDDVMKLKQVIAGADSKYKQRLLIRSGNKLQYKPTSAVSYFFADGKMAYLVGNDGKKAIIDHTLEELEERILNPRQFFRISRKYIVNFDSVHEVKSFTSSRLEVKLNHACEHDLSVSRERVHDFKTWLDR